MPGLVAAGLAAATLAVDLRDPHVAGSWGVCPLVQVFGVWCPACGGLRATYDLTHGDLAAAASSNLLVVLFAPVVVALLAGWLVAGWRGRDVRRPRLLRVPTAPAVVVLVGVVLAFTVLRNLPGSWLAP